MVRPPVARQALLDAMRAELIENSASADLSTIVARAGVSTGAVYHHFGSKVGLLAAVYVEFFDASERAVLQADRAGRTWIERLHNRTRAMVEHYLKDPLGRVILEHTAEHSAVSELETAYLTRATDSSLAGLRKGHESGILAADLDIDLAAAYLVGGLRRALAELLRRDPLPTTDEATAALWRLITATLGLPNAH